jgi:hypothetical protein
MRKELEQKLVEHWSTWFNVNGDIRCTAMPRGFEHDDGWFDILWRLFADLHPLAAEVEKQTGLPFEVLQVKEKFGGLRVHVNDKNDAIRQRIEIAQHESLHTCEICGQPGRLHDDSWIKTVCDEHARTLGAREIG